MILAPPASRNSRPPPQTWGGVLIIVLWIAFGLVSLTLYFAHAMSLELHAARNRVAGLQAEQAIEGAARYVSYLLANSQTARLDQASSSFATARPEGARAVGEAWFWLLQPALPNTQADQPAFGLVDEASKLNLNTATREMLEALPGMTPAIASAVIDWRDDNDEPETEGAEDDTYLRLNPAYNCKNAPFESVDELRLVYGINATILYGEDLNRNGVLDPNENDGDLTPPSDNRDGRLDRGLIAYLTVYTRQPNTREDGSARLDVNNTNRDELRALLQEKFNEERANAILARTPGGNRTSLLQFYLDSGMTAEEFAQVQNDLSIGAAPFLEGLVNINSAPEEVLAALPGIGPDRAREVVAHRDSHANELGSVAWLTEVLDRTQALAAGPFVTTTSHQFTADVAAVGRHGRGYRRVQFVLDAAEETPKLIYRRDLTDLGWALGQRIRQSLLPAHANITLR